MNTDLSAFVEHARQKGMDQATIRMPLISSGWKEKDVVEALAKTGLEMPIPAPPDRGGAREAVVHLLAFAAFYSSVIAVVTLLFHYINRLFPDPAQAQHAAAWEMSSIRWSLAFVIVSFPSYLWMSRVLLREMRAHPERAWSATPLVDLPHALPGLDRRRGGRGDGGVPPAGGRTDHAVRTEGPRRARRRRAGAGLLDQVWNHPAGRHCFEFDVLQP